MTKGYLALAVHGSMDAGVPKQTNTMSVAFLTGLHGPMVAIKGRIFGRG